MVRPVLLLSIVLTLSGCTMTAPTRTATLVGGVAMTIGGIAVVRSGAVDSDGNGTNDFAGSMLLVAGVLTLLAAATSTEPTTNTPPPTPVIEQPVAFTTPRVSIEGLPPVPDLRASDEVLRLARQLRSAAAYGNCDAA